MAPNKSISSVVLPPRKLIYKSQVNDELNFTMLPSPIQNHSPSPIQNHSPSPIQNQKRAIWNNSVEFYGPHFSNEDLVMLGDFQTEKRCFSRFRHYEKAIRNTNAKFSVDEYEVFQLQHLITTEIPGA
ncbi:14343_t:CDS:2 [Gigaspora rosea]|nr:14343_t:CDS:2 [Gigaspora rosea]